MKQITRLLGLISMVGVLALAEVQSAGAQAVDSLQVTVPSLNMPPDQQLELAKAIYQQLIGQSVSPATLVLVDELGAQVSFDAATLAAP